MMRPQISSNRQIGEPEVSPPEQTDSAVREQVSDEQLTIVYDLNSVAAERTVNQVAMALGGLESTAETGIEASGFMEQMAPQDATDLMFVAQMIATNEAAHKFLLRSVLEGQSIAAADANVLRATRLMKVFMQLSETREKRKGKANQQNFRVEQVNVHQGGQAIVGTVRISREEGK